MNYLFLNGATVATLNEALVPHFMGLQQEALVKMADGLGRAVRDDVQVDLDNLYDFRDEIISAAGASLVGVTDLGTYYISTNVEGVLQEIGAALATPPSVAWGSITGTLSSQADLQSALNTKVDDSQISAFGLTLVDDANAAAARTTLGLGTAATNNTGDFQAADAGLASIAGLTTLADRSIYTTASDTYAVYTLSAFARTILDDANAAAVRTTIGAGTGNGTVTTMSVVTANGVSGSVATATTTPAITLTLGAITPSSVNASGTITAGNVISSTGASATLSFANRAGTARTYSWYGTSNIINLNVSGIGDVASITETGNASFIGTVADLKGNVRSVPITDQNAAYTFVASDRGTARRKTNSTAYTYTVDAVHSAGDILTAVNHNATGNITIAQGAGVTLYLAGTGTTGNRTVGPRSYATIYMMSATEGYVSGPGVT